MRKIAVWFRAHPLTSILLGFVVFTVGLHLFANWRAEVRWQRYCAEARARGVKLTVEEFTPPAIPDAENFAALPMMRAAMNPKAKAAFKLPSGKSPPYYNYPKGERVDFDTWAGYFVNAGFIKATTGSAPKDVLLALEHYAPEIAEWREWRNRPDCQFPVILDGVGFMQGPNYSTFSNAFQIFSLRMQAHLAVHDLPEAVRDMEDALQTGRALERPHSLVTGVLRLGLLAMICGQVGETLAAQSWSDAELRTLDAALAAIRPALDYRRALSAERVCTNSLYERLVTAPEYRENVALYSGVSAPKFAYRFIPSRVFRDNQLRQNQLLDEMLATVRVDALQFDPDTALPSGPANLKGYLEGYYFLLFKLFAEVGPTVAGQYLSLKNRVDQTRLAIALERFRLARGAFPETLAELVPEFIAALPVETYSRQPMIYRRKEGGTFLLYGVGKNRTDDRGVWDAKGSDGEKLDDVWRYAPPAR